MQEQISMKLMLLMRMMLMRLKYNLMERALQVPKTAIKLVRRGQNKGLLRICIFFPNLEKVVQGKREGKMKQAAISETCKKELGGRAYTEIAKWFYDAGISYNAAKLESFSLAVEAIGQYGPGMKPPSYDELRGPLLRKEVDHTKELVQSYEEDWARHGCSIVSNRWRDSVSNRDIMSFFVSSPKGVVFIRSIDVSNIMKNANALFHVLDRMVEEIGETNVIQVLTDNTSNFVAIAKLLKAK